MSLDLIESGSFISDDVAPRATNQLRIISWNIARGARLNQIIEFLRAANADLVCLQEADRNALRTGRRNIASEIASALRMNYAFGVEFEELSECDGNLRAHHGQATLSPFPLTSVRVLRFARQSRFWHPYWFVPKLAMFQRRIGGRMALLSHVRIREMTVAVYNVHLESRSEKVRQDQLSETLTSARQYDPEVPILVAGDFNLDAAQNSAAPTIDAARFENPFRNKGERTTPTTHFGRRDAIDWILFKGKMRVVTAQVHDSVTASDHYPLSLTLDVF